MFNIFKKRFLVIFEYFEKNERGIGNIMAWSYFNVSTTGMEALSQNIKNTIEKMENIKVDKVIITNIIKCRRG